MSIPEEGYSRNAPCAINPISTSLLLFELKLFAGLFIACIINLCHCLGEMLVNATFNNMSVISWRSVLLVE